MDSEEKTQFYYRKAKWRSDQNRKKINSREVDRKTDLWIDAMLERRQTPGSFIRAQTITDTINLGAVALRANKKSGF
ncbi:hypothetical protein [Algoriphagus boritolerans]|uniref:hypothetical protein n=1 Tax=Algoriphagus boritolerans TaxID=308111 RepID=UPI002FCE3670